MAGVFRSDEKKPKHDIDIMRGFRRYQSGKERQTDMTYPIEKYNTLQSFQLGSLLSGRCHAVLEPFPL